VKACRDQKSLSWGPAEFFGETDSVPLCALPIGREESGKNSERTAGPSRSEDHRPLVEKKYARVCLKTKNEECV